MGCRSGDVGRDEISSILERRFRIRRRRKLILAPSANQNLSTRGRAGMIWINSGRAAATCIELIGPLLEPVAPDRSFCGASTLHV